MKERIRVVEISKINNADYKRHHVGCLVLTKNNEILLQQRGVDWDRFPGYLSTFGGRIELGESPIQALIRELHEELGAIVNEVDVISLGAISEKMTSYTELIYVYFWHDKLGTITGCYEGEPRYYKNIEVIFEHPKLMDDVYWILSESKKMRILK